jgi:hypothetical protein
LARKDAIEVDVTDNGDSDSDESGAEMITHTDDHVKLLDLDPAHEL